MSAARLRGGQQFETEEVFQRLEKTAGTVAVTETLPGMFDLIERDMVVTESDSIVLDLKLRERLGFENSDECILLASPVPCQRGAHEDIQEPEL